jgi:hypothetical protein
MAGRYMDCAQCGAIDKLLEKVEAFLLWDLAQELPIYGSSDNENMNNKNTSVVEETSSPSASTSGKYDDLLAKALVAQIARGSVASLEFEFSHGSQKFLGALNDAECECNSEDEPLAKRAKTSHEGEARSGSDGEKGPDASEGPGI